MTRMLVWISHALQHWGLALAAALAALVALTVLFVRTERGRTFRDHLFMRLPAVRELVRYTVVARFCRVFGALLSAGVPAHEALSLSAAATNNRVFQRGLLPVRAALIQGEGIPPCRSPVRTSSRRTSAR